MADRRVVVTGLGMVSPLGLTVPENWQNILGGKSGVQLVTQFPTDDLNTKIAASVPNNFDPSQYIPIKDVKKLDAFIHYAVAASDEAVQDAGLNFEQLNRERIGVNVGSGIGGLSLIEKNALQLAEQGPRRISPFFIPGCIINMASGYLSIKYHVNGPNFAIATACTTGSHNIGYAARTIAYGDADVMITGGTEMVTGRLGISGFSVLRALSERNDNPEAASRPWDKDRDGFVLGEGAGVLILEEYEHAKKRGAKIYAELKGFGMSADASHMTANDQTGAIPALGMNNALNDACLNPEDIQYINAHATSTPVGDPAEVKAIKLTFGADAYKVAVSSTKSMTGHLIGAAGAVEAIYSILALRDQVAPPTINLDNPDVDCDLNFVPHVAQEMKINAVLSNSFGFGGTNGSLIFTKV